MSRTVRREVEGHDWRLWPGQVAGADWTKVFGVPAGAPLRLHVDVGFGGGEFLIGLAERYPDQACVGIELGFDRVLKLAHRLARTSIQNVRLIGTAAEWAVREAFEDGSVESFWINFPDPWPKRHHRRRRLITPRFVRDLGRKLSPTGSLHVATDDPDYARAIDAVLRDARGLRNVHAPDPCRHERSALTETAFEREWRGRGLRCFYFHYVPDVPHGDSLHDHIGNHHER